MPVGYGGLSRKTRFWVWRSVRTARSKLGAWERECLDYAQHAIRANFLKLILTSIEKAIAVTQLPAEEYEYGFHYPSGRASRTRT